METASDPTRYTVAALVTYHDDTARTVLGAATSRRKARRLAYREGVKHHPSLYSSARFDLEIIDTATGERIPADWAEGEVYRRLCALPTVAEVGYW